MNHSLDYYEARSAHVFDELGSALSQFTLYPGRLAQSLEGAGKRPFFVLGNWFKEGLLRPIHDWAMAILGQIPTDGTFCQDRPIHRLSRYQPEYDASFDLSAATDRWPVSTIHN